ncbi:major facilitator superfamily domain-containing protein [Halteromyces radiatus]|uniref:major facilitator superfamily domain-containing protein n=1 Tax=Halteromyces radiatus TaxID=101107 RepID=UPI0022209BA1|nr:major facilitator superfamily domain-containing protein [Halteromyces radiatus]KAI8096594.1 major facilitator superfamily domain-containing protein [Halteromyces radiatus]
MSFFHPDSEKCNNNKDYSIDHHDDDKDQQDEDDDFREDIYGWFIVCAAFMAQMTGLGIISSVLQDHYEQHVFGANVHTAFYLSLVGALANCVMNLMSVFAQILLSKFGIKGVMLVACILCTSGLELASLSTEIWHLLLTQGVLFGSGCSIIFYVGMSTVPQWFKKREGIALGIVSSGSCIGGLVMPFIITPLNRSLGVSWCYRVLGLISLVIFVCACILFKDKTARQENKKIKDIVDLAVLKNRDLLVWCFADTLIEMGYYVPYFFLPSYGTFLGLSDSQGSLLISTASACNAIGRIITGHIGDKIGYMNTTIISCFIAGSSSLLLWSFAFDFGLLMAFASIYGLTGGVFVSLGPSITKIVEKDRFDSGYSLFLILTMLAMFGPNLAAAVESSVHSYSFLTYKLFTGMAYVVGTLVLLYLKIKLCHGNLFARL